MKKLILLFSILFFIFLSADAKGKFIELHELVEESKLIVLAEYTGSNSLRTRFHLTVERVLKGNPIRKKITVGKDRNGTPRVKKGTRCIAFINRQDEWTVVGFSEDFCLDPVYLEGFYDYNSYDVFPYAISMKQFETYLETGTYSGTASGSLGLFSLETLSWEEMPLHFDISYTYANDMHSTVSVTGMKIPGFTSTPEVYFWGAGASVTYSQSTYRPLYFNSWSMQCDSAGTHFSAKFELNEPENISIEEFERYISDESMGHIYYEMELRSDSASCTLMYEGPNYFDTFLLYNGKRYDYSQSSLPDEEYEGRFILGPESDRYELVIYKFEKNEKYKDLDFFQRLYYEPTQAELFKVEKDLLKTSVGKFTLTLKAKHFGVLEY